MESAALGPGRLNHPYIDEGSSEVSRQLMGRADKAIGLAYLASGAARIGVRLGWPVAWA